MTTEDPFTAPPAAPVPYTPQPPAYTPPPPGGFGYSPVKPSGLATAAIVLTGLYTASSLLAALVSPSTVQGIKDQAENPNEFKVDASTFVGLLGSLVAVASFVFLALWMWRIRGNRTALGVTPGGPPAVEWWGWFVPFANFVLPALGMRAITRGLVGAGRVLGWWIPFCLSFVVSGAASVSQFTARDLSTGKITDPAALDAMVPLTWASAILIALSWLFLVTIIRKTTDRHLEAGRS